MLNSRKSIQQKVKSARETNRELLGGFRDEQTLPGVVFHIYDIMKQPWPSVTAHRSLPSIVGSDV